MNGSSTVLKHERRSKEQERLDCHSKWHDLYLENDVSLLAYSEMSACYKHIKTHKKAETPLKQQLKVKEEEEYEQVMVARVNQEGEEPVQEVGPQEASQGWSI